MTCFCDFFQKVAQKLFFRGSSDLCAKSKGDGVEPSPWFTSDILKFFAVPVAQSQRGRVQRPSDRTTAMFAQTRNADQSQIA